jgi:hypothetical protein
MKTILINKTLEDFLINLLNKRVKFLHNYKKRQQKLGFDVDEYNVRIEDNQILFDAFFGKNCEDCGFKIEDDSVTFNVNGMEGADSIKFNVNEDLENISKLIKKHARNVDSGGLK